MMSVMLALHVVAAIFLIGPMSILPMTALRALRARQGGLIATLAKSTKLYSYLSLLVFVFGYGTLEIMRANGGDISVTTPWVLISIVLFVVGVLLNFVLVIPSMDRAAEYLQTNTHETGDAGDAGAKAPAAIAGDYTKIAAGNGVVSLLMIAIAVLMVVQPG